MEHGDSTGNPQQVLQCPRSLLYLVRVGLQQITSKIPPSGAVYKRNKEAWYLAGKETARQVWVGLLDGPGTQVGHRHKQKCYSARPFVYLPSYVLPGVLVG